MTKRQPQLPLRQPPSFSFVFLLWLFFFLLFFISFHSEKSPGRLCVCVCVWVSFFFFLRKVVTTQMSLARPPTCSMFTRRFQNVETNKRQEKSNYSHLEQADHSIDAKNKKFFFFFISKKKKKPFQCDGSTSRLFRHSNQIGQCIVDECIIDGLASSSLVMHAKWIEKNFRTG
jgi:hypothetical protein